MDYITIYSKMGFEVQFYFSREFRKVVGKTTLMHQLFNEFYGKRLWFDLDNPLDQMTFENQDYNAIYHDLAGISGLENDERLLVCIDEIQNLPEITKIIKYLIDHYGVKFIVTGSSNYYLRNLYPESLSGQFFLYVLPVLTYREFLYFNGRITENQLTQTLDEVLQPKSMAMVLKSKERWQRRSVLKSNMLSVMLFQRQETCYILGFYKKSLCGFTNLHKLFL